MGVDEFTVLVNELDDIMMKILHLMKEYIEVKLTLEELIRSGSLHLAKSRYIMGNRSVSALQLPTESSSEFTASAKVLTSNEKASSDVVFELSRLTIESSKENGLKSRHSRNEKAKEEIDDLEKVQDPLKWFGLLVPQNMRQAQSNFSIALDYVVQGANIQVEIDKLKASYDLKIKKKQELLKQC